jgi:hypothetical protein
LKKRWSRLEVVQEVLRKLADLLDVPGGFDLDNHSYFPQLAVLFFDRLDALQEQRSARNDAPPIANDPSGDDLCLRG